MRKIRLNLDSLAVDSFRTSDEEGTAAGTVHGHAATLFPAACPSANCTQQLTCMAGCETNAKGYC